MAQCPINVKACEAAIMIIASVQEGGQTHTMAAKPWWQSCHTM